MLASCATDVKFHDWDSGECLGAVNAPDPKAKGFLDIAWCNAGKNLAAVPISGKSLIVSVSQSSSGKGERWMNKETVEVSGVRCARFSRLESHTLVVGTVTGEVYLYDVGHKKTVQRFADLPATINLIEYGAQDLFVAAGCNNGQIFLYGKTHTVSASYFVPCSDTVTTLSVHPRTAYLLAGGSEKGIIAIWDINNGSCLLKSENHEGAVIDMSFSTTDDTFTTIGSDQKINIYDVRTGECVHEKQFDSNLTALAYCPNGTDIAVATGRGQIICLDKRYLHSCKCGLKTHKCAIRKISFDSSNITTKTCSRNESKTTIEYDTLEDEISPSKSDVKAAASGDYSLSNNKRFGGNRCPTLADKESMGTSRCQMDAITKADRTTFHIIDEFSLNQLRDDIMKATKEIVSNLVESMNNEFLKMRMGVSREFCTMEIRNKKRWQDFNMILLKIADLEESDSHPGSPKETVLSNEKTKITTSQYLNYTPKSIR